MCNANCCRQRSQNKLILGLNQVNGAGTHLKVRCERRHHRPRAYLASELLICVSAALFKWHGSAGPDVVLQEEARLWHPYRNN